jgi:hypothetical protein
MFQLINLNNNINNNINKTINNVGISLGWNCDSASYGVEHNLRGKKSLGYNTCPFDLMVSNIDGVIQCIDDDFKYLTDENFLELIKENEDESTIYNNKYNFAFNHESPGHANLYTKENWKDGKFTYVNNNYKELKLRYNNRVNNFINYCNNPNNFITFIINTWDKKESDLYKLKQVLNKKFPNCKYNFFITNDRNGKDYYIRHLKYMRYTEEDEELKRLL